MKRDPQAFHFSNEPGYPRRGAATIALWLGIWGIVISLVCIYIAMDARNVAKDSERRIERTAEQLQESKDIILDLEASTQETIRLSEQRIEELSFEVRRISSRLRTNSEQLTSTREVISELISNLALQKEALTELATRIPAIPEGVQVTRSQASEAGNARTEPPARPSERVQAPPSPAEPAPRTYTVQTGDTLVDIARRKNLSVPALLDANPEIDPNLIRVGQKLILPE